MNVVTRFAPAPTGFLHIGGARTAIFNYLFACATGGKFFLRIDDTDVSRSTKEYTQQIIDSLKWLGLEWGNAGNEMYQSQRFAHYLAIAEDLVDAGKAYRCYVSDSDAEKIRELQDLKERKEKLRTIRSSKNYTIRFMMPDNEIIFIKDTIAGSISINSSDLDDFIMIREDKTPTYMIASVIDDQEMGVTNIIRGNEHLTNAYRQMFLIKALSYNIPIFTHIPLIQNEQKQKLSKRDGAVSIDEYKEMGILPEAMFNYVLRLGWSKGNEEIITMEEAKKCFNLEALRPSASCFDLKKLTWVNSQYIKNKIPGDELLRRAKVTGAAYTRALLCIDDIKKKADDLKYIYDICQQVFANDRIQLKDELPEIGNKELLFLSKLNFSSLDFSSADTIKSSLTDLISDATVDKKEALMFLRVALTGMKVSPGIFEVIFSLGRDISQSRLLDALLECKERIVEINSVDSKDEVDQEKQVFEQTTS